MEARTKRRIKRTIKLLIIVYCGLGIALWYLQDSIFLQPEKLKAGYTYKFQQKFEELNIPINENETLHAVKFLPADTGSSKGLILYFHGNKENIVHYAAAAALLTGYGYEVWMPEYPGFGKANGVFKEDRLYTNADLLYKLALKKFTVDAITVYGRSLGTGVAAELASYAPCKQVILETPYYSMPELAGAHFPIYPTANIIRYRFPLYEYLPLIKVPVTIFHGTADGIIPYKHAVRLKPLLKKGDVFVTIENGSHNNLASFSVYNQKLDSLLR
jgi:pimeloyl-ACP methyl ester carboxylesterase